MDREELAWEIVYLDGSRFSSADGGPEMAPRTKVHAIIQDDPTHGCKILTSSEGRWYWRFGRWWESEIEGCVLYRFTSVGTWCLELAGEWIPDEKLKEIQDEVRNREQHWKSSWAPKERRVR
jgi:hypothetical protein